ncbi:MAG: Dihydropteroate synthase [Legionellaceae bacterium]
MGILNITPDSFSDGGLYYPLDKALFHAERLIQEGADIIDIGGESTRPGAESVSLQTELDRVMPVIEALRREFPILLSIDTQKPAVMEAAIKIGINIVNDIFALQAEGALEIIANSDVAICLMHMQGKPKTMQNKVFEGDIIQEVKQFFDKRINACVNAGIDKKRIIIDPGFGFGKSIHDNLILIRDLALLNENNLPLLVGVSRKSTIGAIIDAAPQDRLYGSLAMETLAIVNGAHIIRAHDIKPTVDAIKITHAVLHS